MGEVNFFDHGSVDRHCDSLDSYEEKIRFLKRVIIEVENDPDAHVPDWYYDFSPGPPLREKQQAGQTVLHFAELTLTKCQRLLALETEGVSAPDNGQNLLDEEKAVSDEAGRLSIAQSVWATHYLLSQAGMSYANVSRTDVARFISALTGRNYDGVYRRLSDKRQSTEKQTQADRAAIRPFFERLGFVTIVEKIDRGEE